MNNLGLDIENEKQFNQFMLWMDEAKSIVSIDMKPVIFRDLSEEEKTIRFDVVFSFDIKVEEGIKIITKELQDEYPDYTITISPDVDITD